MANDLAELAALAATSPDRFRLDGRVALVVGGSSGLGQAMALALAAEGADVSIAGLGPTGLDDTVAAIEGLGRKASSHDVDATDEALVEQLIAAVVAEHGRLDILVNSQGVPPYLTPAAEYSSENWHRVIATNLESVFLCCKYAGRVMLEQGYGKIINISSVRGFQGRAGDMAYAPAKGGVNQLTKSLAIEWGAKGINVNGIAPTFIKTPLSSGELDDPEWQRWALSRIPKGRIGRRDDLFGPVVFLASDASDMVNGHVLPVDGGWLGA